MPKYTSNYNLTKPLANELYNIDIQNNNMDVVDTNLKKNSDIATEANNRSKTNASNLEALKTFQEDPFEETGSIVRVDLFQDAPLNIVSNLEPIQSGSGDPYPAGCGKNLLNVTATDTTWNGVTFTINDDGSVTLNGTATELSYLNNKVTLPAGEYFVNGCPSGGNVTTGYFVRVVANDQTIGDDVGNGLALTLNEESEVIVRIAVRSGCKVTNLVFKPMVTLASETDKTYAPYANIRPITGHTGMTITRCKKNLIPYPYQGDTGFERNGIVVSVNNDRSITVKGTSTKTDSFPIVNNLKLPVGKYRLSGAPSGSSDNCRLQANVVKAGEHFTGAIDNGSGSTLTVDKTVEYVYIYISIVNGANVNLTFKPQLEIGTSATGYEEYSGNTFEVEIGNTVYGGTLNWNTGTLVVDRIVKIFDGTETFKTTKGSGGGLDYHAYNLTNNSIPKFPYSTNKVNCSHFKVGEVRSTSTVYNAVSVMSPADLSWGQINFRQQINGQTSVDALKAYMAEQYAAGTPVTVTWEPCVISRIQLTSHTISALAGLNTVYSSNAETTVSGRKDIIWLTHSLIERIAALEAQAAGL